MATFNMIAKFGGKCPICNTNFPAGTPIAYDKAEKKAYHQTCVPQNGAPVVSETPKKWINVAKMVEGLTEELKANAMEIEMYPANMQDPDLDKARDSLVDANTQILVKIAEVSAPQAGDKIKVIGGSLVVIGYEATLLWVGIGKFGPSVHFMANGFKPYLKPSFVQVMGRWI